jgi:outer membrane protein
MALALLAMTGLATAASADEGNAIAVVNIGQVMRESTAAKMVREQLESKYKGFQADISKKQESLQKEDQELGKKKSVLSKEAFEEKASEFRKKVTEAQKDAQTKKVMFDNASARSSEEIQKAVTGIVAELAKEKGFVLAVSSENPTSQILYADSKLDISAEVIKRLNDKLPKLDVKFEAPAKSEKK